MGNDVNKYKTSYILTTENLNMSGGIQDFTKGGRQPLSLGQKLFIWQDFFAENCIGPREGSCP